MADLKTVLAEIVNFEKKKLVLPILMCLILFSAVLSIEYARDVKEYDEKVTNRSLVMMTSLTEEFIVRSSFNSTESKQYIERLNRTQKKIQSKENRYFKEMKWAIPVAAVYGPSRHGYRLFPLVPGAPVGFASGGIKGAESVIFSPRDGYRVSTEMQETLSMIYYRQKAFTSLEEDIKKQNLVFEEYKDRAQEIKSRDIRQILQKHPGSFGRNYTGIRHQNRMNGVEKALAEHIKDGTVKDVQWYHFIPSFFATFTMYYLVNGALVVGIRGLRRKLNSYDSDSHKSFSQPPKQHDRPENRRM